MSWHHRYDKYLRAFTVNYVNRFFPRSSSGKIVGYNYEGLPDIVKNFYEST